MKLVPDDAQEFEVAFQQVSRSAFLLARQVGRSTEEARDIVQEAALQGWRYRGGRIGEFRPWFLTIVYRLARRRTAIWLPLPPRWDRPAGDSFHHGLQRCSRQATSLPRPRCSAPAPDSLTPGGHKMSQPVSLEEVDARLRSLPASLVVGPQDSWAIAHLATFRILDGRPRHRPVRLAVALGLALALIVLGNLGAVYYAPAYGRALADAPVVGAVSGQMLTFSASLSAMSPRSIMPPSRRVTRSGWSQGLPMGCAPSCSSKSTASE